MKPPKTSREEVSIRAAQRRQSVVDRLQAERAARAEAEQRATKERESQIAYLREQQRLARQIEAEQNRLDDETLAAALARQQEEQQREARASKLREAQQRERQNEAARIGREAEAHTKALRKQEQEHELEHRVTRSHEAERPARQSEPAQSERLLQTRAEALRRPQEARKFELVAARSREVERAERQSEAARTERAQHHNLRAAALSEAERTARRREEARKQQEQNRRERRAAELREAHELARHSEAVRIEHEASSRAAVPEPPRETHGSLLRNERRRARQSETARLKSDEHRRLAEQERARAVARVEEEQHQEKLRAQERAAAEAALEQQRSGRERCETPPKEPAAEGPRKIGRELLPLRTQGRFIVDSNAGAVNLRGVTVIGLGSTTPVGNQTFRGALSLDDANLSVLTQRWGVNLVRLPFQVRTLPDADMLAGLDETVGAITTAGAYVLLVVEPSSPDDDALQSWQLLAGRYRDEPGVVYEIVAPPPAFPAHWLHRAVRLAGIIRRQSPASLIFVGSGHGGIDVTGLPLRFSTGELVFNTVSTIDVSQHHHPGHDNRQLHALAGSSPVFATGWSETGQHLGRLSKDVADFFARHAIGWAASSWNAHPRLVADAAKHDFTPTGWGHLVQHALAQPARPLYQPFHLR